MRKTYVTSWTPPSFPRSRSTGSEHAFVARSSTPTHAHLSTGRILRNPIEDPWRIVASMHRIESSGPRTWPGDNPILGAWRHYPGEPGLPPHGLENTLAIGAPSVTHLSPRRITRISPLFISSRFLPCVIVAAKSRRGDLCHPLFFSRQRRRREGRSSSLLNFGNTG